MELALSACLLQKRLFSLAAKFRGVSIYGNPCFSPPKHFNIARRWTNAHRHQISTGNRNSFNRNLFTALHLAKYSCRKKRQLCYFNTVFKLILNIKIHRVNSQKFECVPRNTLCNYDRGMCPQKALNYQFSVYAAFSYKFCMHKPLKCAFRMIKVKTK